jgi:hypothetical protein
VWVVASIEVRAMRRIATQDDLKKMQEEKEKTRIEGCVCVSKSHCVGVAFSRGRGLCDSVLDSSHAEDAIDVPTERVRKRLLFMTCMIAKRHINGQGATQISLRHAQSGESFTG